MDSIARNRPRYVSVLPGSASISPIGSSVSCSMYGAAVVASLDVDLHASDGHPTMQLTD